MELKYLYTLKKILETGSYQNAASALNYAQSTITFHIKQLENELSLQLFERKGVKMELTQAGKEILPLIDTVLASVDELLSYSAQRNTVRGRLTLALPESLAVYQMQSVLHAFKVKAPDVKLSMQVMNCYAIYERMISRELDVAIHYDIGRYPAGFITKKLGTYPLTLICSTVLEEADRDFVSPNQKKRLCHIQNDSNALYLKIFHQYLRQKNIALKPELEAWSIETVKKSVASGLGVAFLPRFTVESELSQGIFQELRTDMEHPEMTALCAYQKGKRQDPAMKLFLQILDRHYGK